jgi:hypothetical protein
MAAPRLATAYFHTPDVAYLLQYFCIYFLLINFFQVMGSLFVSTQQVKRSQGIEVVRMRTIVAGTYRAMTADLLYPIVFVQIWLTGLLV